MKLTLILLTGLLQGTPMDPRLTELDMIKIIDEYNVMHTWINPFRIDDSTSYLLYGSTNHGSKNIILNDAVGSKEQRYITVIHEMLHVKYRMEDIPRTEGEVRIDAHREYERIFHGN